MIDAFKIGVHIGFSSNGPQVLGTLLRSLIGINVQAKELNRHFDRMRGLIVGALGVWAGEATLRGLWHLTEAAKDLNKELNRTQSLGGDFARTIGDQRALAFRVSRDVPTALPEEVVRWQREIGVQLGGPQAAAPVMPDVARFAWIIEHFTGKPADDAVRDAARAIFDRGAVFSRGADGKEVADPAKFAAELNAMMKAIILSGGLLKASDILQIVRQAGPAARAMDPVAFWSQQAEAAIALGASKSGTAMMSLFQQFAGGIITKRVAEEMLHIGLLQPGEFQVGRGGHVEVTREATERLGATFKDPFEYIQSTLMPLLAAKGYDGPKMLAEIARLFGRQTTQRLVAEILQNNPQFQRARSMFPEIQDAPQIQQRLHAEDLDTNLRELTVAWKAFEEALGSPGIRVAIGVLHGLTAVLHELADTVEANPIGTTILLDVAALLLAAVMVGGSIKVIAVALGPLNTALKLMKGTTVAMEAAAAATAAEETTLKAAMSGTSAAATDAATGVGAFVAKLRTLLGVVGIAVLAIEGLNYLKKFIGHDDVKPNASTGLPQAQPNFSVPGSGVGAGGMIDPAHPGRLIPPPPPPVGPAGRTGGAGHASYEPGDGGGHGITVPVLTAAFRQAMTQDRTQPTGGEGQPIRVIVVNAGDVGAAAASGTVRRISDGAWRPPTGPSGGDLRAGPAYPSRMPVV